MTCSVRLRRGCSSEGGGSSGLHRPRAEGKHDFDRLGDTSLPADPLEVLVREHEGLEGESGVGEPPDNGEGLVRVLVVGDSDGPVLGNLAGEAAEAVDGEFPGVLRLGSGPGFLSG